MTPTPPTPTPTPAQPSWVKGISKFLAALTGAAGEALAAGLISGTDAKWSEIAIGVVTAGVVYLVPNS
jgi:hypothetical protein